MAPPPTEAPSPALPPEDSDGAPPEFPPNESGWPPSEAVDSGPAPVTPEPAAHPEPEAVAAPSDTVGAPAPQSTLRLPDETGRGLMIGSIATGSLGWAMSLSTIGVVTTDCEAWGACIGQVQTMLYLTGVRWVANGTAMGLGVAAGAQRGRYDATKEAIDGAPARNMDAFVKGGAAALGVGAASWTLLRIGIFTLASRCDGIGCGIGYLAGLQTSFTLASVGAGFLSYGLAYRKQRAGFGPTAEVRLVPQLSAQYNGLSLAGRF